MMDVADLSIEERAHHEAGHAVAATVLPDARPVTSVTLESELEHFAAHCEQVPYEDLFEVADAVPTTPQFVSTVHSDIAVVLAGPIAERRYANDADRQHVGTIGDAIQAQGMADDLLAAPEPEVIEAATAAAHSVVNDYWAAIQAVASALIEKKTLSGDEVRTIVQAVP